MAAYEYFAATTTNTFIEHIKTKAEAYGWTIDYYVAGRLHLHNSDGAHFEIWYGSATSANIRACTGYDSGSGSTAQPGMTGGTTLTVPPHFWHFIIVGKHSIFIKVIIASNSYLNMQFGSVVDKIGGWSGGVFISTTTSATGYTIDLWSSNANRYSQMLINGAWSTSLTNSAGAVFGTCAGSLYGRMPFTYSGGILPCPLMLVQIDPTTSTYYHPIGYAPDVRLFRGGDVYRQLEEITIDGEQWVGVCQGETVTTFSATPDLLYRLYS